VKIVIADDQQLFREMLREMLELDPEFTVVAACSNGQEAVDAIKVYQPDLVVLDIGMPIVNGIDALTSIKLNYPDVKVCLLTTFEDDEKIRQALIAGADGYIVKDLKPKALQLALKCILEGMVVFQKGVHQQMLHRGVVGQRTMEKRYEVEGIIFDSIDIAIIKRIASGCSNRDIAHFMNYSEGTIKNRVSKLLAMTGLADRTEISVFAVKNQLI